MYNLKVLKAYSGVLTHGRTVLPGVYAADDPQVAEASETMIRKGFAELTTELIPDPAAPHAAPAVEFPVDDDDVIGEEVREDGIPVALDDEPDYESLSVAELRELAEAASVEVAGTGKGGAVLKADLIRALRAADGA